MILGLAGLRFAAALVARASSACPPLGTLPWTGTLRTPLGLAAGFDKNGDYLDALGALGFSVMSNWAR